jgi:hypothetical protein
METRRRVERAVIPGGGSVSTGFPVKIILVSMAIVGMVTVDGPGQPFQNQPRRAVRNFPNVVFQHRAAKFGTSDSTGGLAYGIGTMAIETSPPILNLFQRASLTTKRRG